MHIWVSYLPPILSAALAKPLPQQVSEDIYYDGSGILRIKVQGKLIKCLTPLVIQPQDRESCCSTSTSAQVDGYWLLIHPNVWFGKSDCKYY